MDFDYKFYVNNYNDLKNFNEKQALLHWNNFGKNEGRICNYKKKFKLYAVYFPQFYEFEENNINFYKGFTDIINLNNLNVNDKETPKIDNILHYDLMKNNKLIENQIKILNDYNIDGFAFYYYWFTINTITNKKLIMFDVIEKFLNRDMKDKKLFFIWANEDWSKNPAFGNSNHKIENRYDKKNIEEHCSFLVKIFKNKNYLKIHNKPVFYIHHTYFLKENEKKLFENIINNYAKKNGFKGVIVKYNSISMSMQDRIKNKNNIYDFHPDYKNPKMIQTIKNQKYLDYGKYIDDCLKPVSSSQTIFFNFDNRARLLKPNKLHLSTICINNNYENIIKYIDKIKNHIDNNYNDETIILINAFNEWGEKMTIEPSTEKNDYYLKFIPTLYSDNNSIHEQNLKKYILDKPLNLPIKKINKEYIVFVSFNLLGGGTLFFENTIISNYKKYNNFLIIRKFNKIIQVTENDEFLILNTKNYNDVFDIFKNISISFIFINHILGHNVNFINDLSKYCSKIYGISHDFSYIFKNPQPYFENYNKEIKSKINLKIFHKIYCQTLTIKKLFSSYIDPNKIILSPLPDYKLKKEKIITNNKNIHILIIGNISHRKGFHFFKYIYQLIKKFKFNIRLFCAGKINLPIPQKIYNNINEFNNIIINFKPNIILEGSIWQETYSYTLTLSKIMDLPIVYLKKNFDNVIEERLKEYPKKMPIHKNSNPKFIYKVFFELKQNYFYTIQPHIYYPNHFNELFLQ